MTGKKEFDTMKVSKRLHDTHKARSISAENLAGAAGISKQALLNYESAARNGDLLGEKARSVNGMSAETLFNLAEELGVSTDYLLGRTSAPSPDSSIRAVEELTGLSERAVKRLVRIKEEYGYRAYPDILSALLDNTDLETFLYYIGLLISFRQEDLNKPSTPSEMIEKSKERNPLVKVGNSHILVNEKALVESVITSMIIKQIPYICEKYLDINLDGKTLLQYEAEERAFHDEQRAKLDNKEITADEYIQALTDYKEG